MDAHPDIAIPSESLFVIDYLRFADQAPMRMWRWLLAREPQLLCWHEGPLPERSSCAETLIALHELYAHEQGARMWGQKTPRFVRWRGLLDRAFGGGRWILVHRDPRAVVASMLASGQHTHSVARAVRRWRRDNRPVIERSTATVADPDVMIVSHAELVGATEETLARLFAFLDVAPRSLERLIAQARPVFFARSRFASNTIRGGLAPDASTEQQWRSALTQGQVRYIEWHCAHEMRQLGYEPGDGHGPPGLFTRLSCWTSAWRDAWIVVRYLSLWPEYPLWTVIRALVLRLVRIPGRRRQ